MITMTKFAFIIWLALFTLFGTFLGVSLMALIIVGDDDDK